MNIKKIQNIIDKEHDFQNKVKLYERLDKELKGIDRIFLKILKNDIRELGPINNHTE